MDDSCVAKFVSSKKESKLKKQAYDKSRAVIINKFNEIMYELGLYNKFNKTYTVDIYKEENYGYRARIYLATGLNFEDIDKHKATIQQNLKCMLIINYQSNDDCAYAKIITKPIDTTINYTSPNIKAHEMFLGMSYSLEPVVCNCNKNCMFILGGAVGSGKTRLIYMILMSWILSKENKLVELYLSDVAKKEFVAFQDVKQVRSYADNIEDLRDMIEYLHTKIAYRTTLIEPYRKKGLATNIEEYNKLPGVEKMPYNYLLVDEFSVIMPDSSDSKEEKKQKEEIIAYLKKIAKLGRSTGIFSIICTQKMTRDEIPPIVKNMSAVRVSLRANDLISSEVLMGNNAAVGLADRLAVYSLNGGTSQDYLFSPNLTTDKLGALLKPYVSPSTSKVNVKLMTKEMKIFSNRKPNEIEGTCEQIDTPEKNGKSMKNERKVVANLPYEIILHDTSNVIDGTKVKHSASEKPKKKNEVINGWWLLK